MALVGQPPEFWGGRVVGYAQRVGSYFLHDFKLALGSADGECGADSVGVVVVVYALGVDVLAVNDEAAGGVVSDSVDTEAYGKVLSEFRGSLCACQQS